MSTSYNVVPQNANWKVKLFPHQLTAIWMMEDREKNTTISWECENSQQHIELQSNIGIYSDPTGYGKTLSVVGLLSRNSMEWNIQEPYVSKNVRNIKSILFESICQILWKNFCCLINL